MELRRNATRAVKIGSATIGDGHPIAVQSMTATQTQNIDASVAQIEDLFAAGADVIRVAVDSTKDAAALAEIRKQTKAICKKIIAWQKSSHHTSIRFATTRVISIITNAKSPGRKRSDILRLSRRIMTARCALV